MVLTGSFGPEMENPHGSFPSFFLPKAQTTLVFSGVRPAKEMTSDIPLTELKNVTYVSATPIAKEYWFDEMLGLDE